MNPKDTGTSNYITNNYFNKRNDETIQEFQEIGALGGEISAELGFKDLASATEYINQNNTSEDEETREQNENKENESTSSL